MSLFKIVNGVFMFYLVLEIKNMSVIVIMEIWIFNVFVKFGGVKFFDYLNKGRIWIFVFC